MPNWCQNQIELIHPDPSMIEKAAEALQNGVFMETFRPTPKEIVVLPSGEQSEELRPDWYNWRCDNWGCKWDVESDSLDVCGDFLLATFDSPWGPPIIFYQFLEELGFTIKARYFEGGNCFCGYYGEDSIKFDAFESIPDEIREAFSIDSWEDDEIADGLIAIEG